MTDGRRMYARPDRSIDRFAAVPDRSFTLAARFYTDPAIMERERERIFWRSWICVGHVSDVANDGDYLTAEIADQRVFVIRTQAGELKSFFNVCMHRGHALLQGQGTIGRLITCPYHAWAYTPDGKLAGARMSDRMQDFDFADFTLPEVAVEEFCGFVFLNLAEHPTPMAQVYPGLEDAVHQLCPDPSLLTALGTSTFEIAANWKNVGDNLLECYHCHPAHPAFVELIDMETYRNETFQGWSIQSGASRPGNKTYDVSSGAEAFTSIYVWPNLSIGRLPGSDGVSLFQFFPTATETTLQTFTTYGPEGGRGQATQRAMDYFEEILGPEDVALVESVQHGLRSLGYHQGRFICIPDRPEISEHAVHHFHCMVMDALAEM